MASLYRDTAISTPYKDYHFQGSREEFEKKIRSSTTLYVGNLSFYTTEEQIYSLFSMCGEVKRIVMGLDRFKKTPCGFCFVEYYNRKDAEDCIRYINGTRLDDRPIRVDIDYGFTEQRQFGRGKSGGQVRDEMRKDYDAGRGGFGRKEEEMGTGGIEPVERKRPREEEASTSPTTRVREGDQ
eukprot:gnl/Trimastix_PCT/2983.p1 GENE.gnl/Trimastix_PCT/2983~~gnl/Trimastix_PCT/2983.p1  ORF type:complete len:202 (+),score=22.11 gnl/Trimastix_PCT/2983:61-606(+)